MPWKNELPMEQKKRFINLAQSGRFTVSELSEEFGITRKTGHKWLLIPKSLKKWTLHEVHFLGNWGSGFIFFH
jgi:hypothetical protein